MSSNRASYRLPPMPTGIEGLDDILHGGLTPNRMYLVEGVPGSGKTTLGMQFLAAGARRGESVLYVTLSESAEELRDIADSHGWSLEGITVRELLPSERSLEPDDQYTVFHPSEVELTETTKLLLADIEKLKPSRVVFDSLSELRLLSGNPAELTPGEFAQILRRAVDRDGVKVVVIDSINGYLNATPEERFLIIQLHELLSYLGQKGVATIIVSAQRGLIGGTMVSPVDTSYLADAVLLLRYYEAAGEVHQAISVVKKRGGAHERAIREFKLTSGGIFIGEPLRRFRGVLTGVPTPLAEDPGAS